MSGLMGVRDVVAPTRRDVAPNVIAELLLTQARPWGSVPVRLSVAVTATFWALAVLNSIFAGWLAAVRAGAAACSGPTCTVATLGGHPLAALILALCCVAMLTVSAPPTRALREADGRQLAVIVAAGVCGVVALAGVVALLVGVALCLVTALAILVVVADRL
jgi:hypothetical protein